MLRPLLIVFVLGLTAWPQESQSSPKTAAPKADTIPVEAARQANPVKPTSESVAAGKKWYGFDCAMCHGKDGDGKGDMAGDMKAKVADFTDPATLKERTDGELFYIIKNGKGEMPAEGDRLKPTELWNVVNYVRSLAKKAPAEDKAAH